jgi:hypothetical protein
MSDRPMDIREYRDYAKKHHGEKSINNSMLQAMDKASGGKTMNTSQWNEMNAKIKIIAAAQKKGR